MTEVESALREHCEEILGEPVVDVDMPLVTLGATSLRLIGLIARIYRSFGVLMNLDELLADPSIRELGKIIHSRIENPTGAPAPQADDRPAAREVSSYKPLTDLQRPFWDICQYSPAKRAYNEAITYLVEGELDLEVVRRVLERIIADQPALRTAFLAGDAQEPRQQVLSAADMGPAPVEFRDLSAVTEPYESCKNLFRELMRCEFVLSRPPLLRAFVWRIGESRWIVGCVLCHIIIDLWSAHLLARLAANAYQELQNGQPQLASPQTSVALETSVDPVTEFTQVDEQFWRDQISLRPEFVDISKRTRPAIKSYRGDMVRRTLRQRYAATLEPARKAHAVTAASLHLAAFGLLITALAKSSEVTIGVPILLRERPELESVVGLYLNTLPVTIRADDAGTIAEYVAGCSTRLRAAMTHARYPVYRMIRELSVPTALSRAPLFEHNFTYYEKPESTESPEPHGPHATEIEFSAGTSKYDLNFFVTRAGDWLMCKVEYCTALFDEDEASHLISSYEKAVDMVTGATTILLREAKHAIAEFQ